MRRRPPARSAGAETAADEDVYLNYIENVRTVETGLTFRSKELPERSTHLRDRFGTSSVLALGRV